MSIFFKKAPMELDREPKGTEMDDERPPRLEVSLKKQSQKGIWQTRYFVLYDDVMMYYNNSKKEKLVGVIPFQNILYASLIKDSENRLDVLIKSGQETYTFKMSSDFQADARLWSEAIKELSRLAAVKPKYLETDKAGMSGKFWKNPDQMLALRSKFVVPPNTGIRIEGLIDKHFEAAEREENDEGKEEDDEDSEDDGTLEKLQQDVSTVEKSPIPSVDPHPGLKKELEDEEKKRQNEEAFKRLNLGTSSPRPNTDTTTHTD